MNFLRENSELFLWGSVVLGVYALALYLAPAPKRDYEDMTEEERRNYEIEELERLKRL